MTFIESVSLILKSKAKAALIPAYEAIADGRKTQLTDATRIGEQIDRNSLDITANRNGQNEAKTPAGGTAAKSKNRNRSMINSTPNRDLGSVKSSKQGRLNSNEFQDFLL